uniref:Cystatin domain-containing protein n=1 Tax=Leptobrachium leishanense TaxID=445787 RepID=A0A8C5QVR8_9ANUR
MEASKLKLLDGIEETPPLHPVKVEVEEKCGKNFTKFDAVCYKKQVVAGMNYFVKVRGQGAYSSCLAIYVALPHENQPPSFHSVQQDKTQEDEILYF